MSEFIDFPHDSRMNEYERQLAESQEGLERIRRVLANTSDESRQEVVQAIRDAAGIGAFLQQMKSAPAAHPIDEQGQVLLGRALQKHMREARNIHDQVGDLKDGLHGTFDEFSQGA